MQASGFSMGSAGKVRDTVMLLESCIQTFHRRRTSGFGEGCGSGGGGGGTRDKSRVVQSDIFDRIVSTSTSRMHGAAKYYLKTLFLYGFTVSLPYPRAKSLGSPSFTAQFSTVYTVEGQRRTELFYGISR